MTAFFLLALTISAYSAGIGFVFAQSSTAKSQLQSATNAFAQAYNAVSDARKAGANVTILVNRLNNAANSLSQADMAYARGDFNGTIAGSAATILGIQSIVSQAQSLKAAAQVSGRNTFLILIVFSVFGAAVFLSILFLVWRYVKRGYWASISGAKPEVIGE